MMINIYKNILSFILLLSFSIVTYAQKSGEHNYYKDKTNLNKNLNKLSEREVKYMNRWDWYWKTRVDEHGSYTRGSEELYKYVQKKSDEKFCEKSSYAKSYYGFWDCIGPFMPLTGTSSRGIGRIESMWVDPDNSDIILVGTATGGLWKSTDGGQNYECKTDWYTGIGVYDIDVVKGGSVSGNDIVYISTGVQGNGTIKNGQGYSLGVLKSIDGGERFYSTGSLGHKKEELFMRQLMIHPTNPDILYAISYQHIFKSDNRGATWTDITNGIWREGQRYFDIRFHPTDPNVIYVAGENSCIRTQNAEAANGEIEWTSMSSSYMYMSGDFRMSIAVSPLEPNSVFGILHWITTPAGQKYDDHHYMLRKSHQKGANWFSFGGTPQIGRRGPCLGLEIAPDDIDKLYIRIVDLWESIPSGFTHTTFGCCPNNTSDPYLQQKYVHDDIRELVFHKTSSGTYDMYVASDGGVSKSTDGGVTWNDISGNLGVSQFYDIGITQTNPIKIVGGTHDCGTFKYENGIWDNVRGGDGGTTLISHANNDHIVYMVGLYPYITTDNFDKDLYSKLCNLEIVTWNTPIIQHPHNANTFFTFMGLNKEYKVIKTDNAGAYWDTTNAFYDPTEWLILNGLEINKINPNYMYFSGRNPGEPHAPYGFIRRTTNYGNTWTDINNNIGSIINNVDVSDIISHPFNPNQVWVSFGGFSQYQKVYGSSNGGNSWVDLSTGLDNFPVQCLAYDKENDVLYAGTDLGVYYMPLNEGGLLSWDRYGYYFPHVIVSDIEINYETDELIVATYGRGIWRAPLYCPEPEQDIMNTVFYSETRFANSIETWGTLAAGHYVSYRAAYDMHIMSDFHIPKGSVFHGVTKDCQSSYSKAVHENKIEDQCADINTNSPVLETKKDYGNVTVFPNPIVTNINISIPDNTEVVHAYILNMEGQMLLSTKRHASEFSINMSDYEAGVYILKLNYNNRIEEYKIVKN